jgi:hypothetical protein
MTWVKSYNEYVNESVFIKEGKSDQAVADLEKLLNLPSNSGVFQSVMYDKAEKILVIEQPTNLSSLDSGAILSAINQHKPAIKKAYSGIQKVMIDNNMQIKI